MYSTCGIRMKIVFMNVTSNRLIFTKHHSLLHTAAHSKVLRGQTDCIDVLIRFALTINEFAINKKDERRNLHRNVCGSPEFSFARVYGFVPSSFVLHLFRRHKKPLIRFCFVFFSVCGTFIGIRNCIKSSRRPKYMGQLM